MGLAVRDCCPAARVTALASVSGEATCTVVRGTRRAGFDFDVTLEWEAAAGGGQAGGASSAAAAAAAAKGTARLPSLASDDLGDLAVVEVAVAEGEGEAPRGLAAALAGAVGAALAGLPGELAKLEK